LVLGERCGKGHTEVWRLHRGAIIGTYQFPVVLTMEREPPACTRYDCFLSKPVIPELWHYSKYYRKVKFCYASVFPKKRMKIIDTKYHLWQNVSWQEGSPSLMQEKPKNGGRDGSG